MTNLGLYNEDPAFIADFLKTWLEMSDDYERNKDTGHFVNDMTECYVRYNHGLVPDEYGLVVIDYINHIILTSQYYTSIGILNSIHFRQEAEYPNLVPYEDTYTKQFCDLWDAGHVTRVDACPSIYAEVRKAFRKKDQHNYENVNWLDGNTASEVMEIIDPLKGLWEYTFYIDPRPFVIENFREGKGFFDNETGNDWSRMYNRILELGFILTPEEEAIWAGRINETQGAPLTVFGNRVID
jgi:hypothetical protein